LVWFTDDEAGAALGADFVAEARQFIGATMGRGCVDKGIDYWRCSKCGDAGALPIAFRFNVA
jgi:hypothetical protein